jgi:hypothetical protein
MNGNFSTQTLRRNEGFNLKTDIKILIIESILLLICHNFYNNNDYFYLRVQDYVGNPKGDSKKKKKNSVVLVR